MQVRASYDGGFWLPIRVMRAVEGRGGGFGMDVENIMAAPGRRVGIVLDGLKIPIGMSSHGIHREATKEANFLRAAHAKQLAFNECFQIRGIAFVSHFHADEVAVRIIFIVVDSITNIAKIAAKFFLLGPYHRNAYHGQSRGSEDGEN